MPLLTITLVFPRLTFKPLLSKAYFHFMNLFVSPSIASLIRTKSSAYSNSFSAAPLAKAVMTSTTTARRKGGSTDPWCITTLTSSSSTNSKSTLTLVFAPSYRFITDLTNTSGIPFFLIAHSNTFLGTLTLAFSLSTKHIRLFSSSMILFLHPSQNKHGINCSCQTLRKITFHGQLLFYEAFFSNTLSFTFTPYSRSFTVL